MMDDRSSHIDVRMPLLQRLAEQAMSDEAFRSVARHDLDRALTEYGYDLNERERSLVFRFRDALADAGVDLFLAQGDSEQGVDVARGFEQLTSVEELERMLDARERSTEN